MLVIPVMLLTGCAVGLINGLMLVKGRMPHAFIPTLATLNAARGLALLLSDGAPMPGHAQDRADRGLRRRSGRSRSRSSSSPSLAVLAWVLARAAVGRWIYLVGGDQEAARRLGIPVDRVIMLGLRVVRASAGLAGLITAGRTNAGYPSAGQLDELAAISAVIIGGASFWGGRGKVSGAIVGALIFGVINNGLNLLNVSTYWQLIAIGVIVVAPSSSTSCGARLEERFRTIQARRAS